jgi:hypothetical protein
MVGDRQSIAGARWSHRPHQSPPATRPQKLAVRHGTCPQPLQTGTGTGVGAQGPQSPTHRTEGVPTTLHAAPARSPRKQPLHRHRHRRRRSPHRTGPRQSRALWPGYCHLPIPHGHAVELETPFSPTLVFYILSSCKYTVMSSVDLPPLPPPPRTHVPAGSSGHRSTAGPCLP